MGTPNTGTLAERAMLVALRQSCWLPGRVDTRVSRETAAAHNVSARRVVTRKYVIDPKTPSYAAVRTAFGDLRTRHYWYTLPWAHRGPRILPAVSFSKYSEDMARLTQRAEECVDVFESEYPRLKVLALAEDTKGLIVPADFPEHIRGHFGIEHQVMPIPTVGDFRLKMTDEAAQALRQQMEHGIATQEREALAVAMREPYRRLYKHVTRMVERLSDKDGTFHDTLVTGLRDLTAMMAVLNITDDEQLDTLRIAAEKLVANVDPEQLRDVPLIRERVAQEAQALKELLEPHVAVNSLTATEADAITSQAASAEAAMGSMFGFNSGGDFQ